MATSETAWRLAASAPRGLPELSSQELDLQSELLRLQEQQARAHAEAHAIAQAQAQLQARLLAQSRREVQEWRAAHLILEAEEQDPALEASRSEAALQAQRRLQREGQGERRNSSRAGVVEMMEYVRGLGLDPLAEPDLLWAADGAFNAELPPGWSEHQDGQGRVYFHNSSSGESTWRHPHEDRFREAVSLQGSQPDGLELGQEIAAIEEDVHRELADWAEFHDERGDLWFHNSRTNESTRADPRPGAYHALYARARRAVQLRQRSLRLQSYAGGVAESAAGRRPPAPSSADVGAGGQEPGPPSSGDEERVRAASLLQARWRARVAERRRAPPAQGGQEERAAAALLLQCAARGFLARRRRRREAARRASRRLALDRLAGVCQGRLVACLGHLLRAARDRQEETAAAVVAQRLWRGRQAREAGRRRAAEAAAARRLQSAWRGAQARRRVAGVRRDLAQHGGAVVIQHAFRAFLARWRAAAAIQRAVRPALARWRRSRLREAASAVRGAARALLARQELERLHAAEEVLRRSDALAAQRQRCACRIQALWRGGRARSAAGAARRAAAADAERRRAAAAEDAERQHAERQGAEDAERQGAEDAERQVAERQDAEDAERQHAERQGAEDAERQDAEDAERQDAERQAAEDAEQQHAERQHAEDAERQDAEDAERQHAERQAAEDAERQHAVRQDAVRQGTEVEREPAAPARGPLAPRERTRPRDPPPLRSWEEELQSMPPGHLAQAFLAVADECYESVLHPTSPAKRASAPEVVEKGRLLQRRPSLASTAERLTAEEMKRWLARQAAAATAERARKTREAEVEKLLREKALQRQQGKRPKDRKKMKSAGESILGTQRGDAEEQAAGPHPPAPVGEPAPPWAAMGRGASVARLAQVPTPTSDKPRGKVVHVHVHHHTHQEAEAAPAPASPDQRGRAPSEPALAASPPRRSPPLAPATPATRRLRLEGASSSPSLSFLPPVPSAEPRRPEPARALGAPYAEPVRRPGARAAAAVR